MSEAQRTDFSTTTVVCDRLVYAGKARSGYTEQVAREVRERLDALITRKCPLDVPIKIPKATWVRPVVDAEIEYSGVTDDGLLRAAVFKGLRDDLASEPPSAPARTGARTRLTSRTLADLARLTAADGAARLRPLRAPRQCRRDTLIARYGFDDDLLH